MDTKRERLLQYAWGRFMESGYSGVTVEEIARACGTGKAAVYQEFGSKKELLFRCIEAFANQVEQGMDAVLTEESVPPDEKMRRLVGPLLRDLSRVNPPALADIRRSAPEAYELIEENRRRIIFENLTKVIEEGRRSGTFRKDVDPKLVTYLTIGAVSYAARPDVLTQLDAAPAQALRGILEVVIRGCLA